MDNPTPFHENHERPAGYNTLPPPPPKTKVPVWAWGLGVLLLGLIIALVVAFSTGDDKKEPEAAPAPAVTVTATATPEPTPTQPPVASGIQDRAPVIMSQSQFLNLVRGESPYLLDTSDEEIMAYSDAVCDAMDEGNTPEEVVTAIEDGSASKAEAYGKGIVAGLTVQNYCPEYSGDFEKFLNAQGPTVES